MALRPYTIKVQKDIEVLEEKLSDIRSQVERNVMQVHLEKLKQLVNTNKTLEAEAEGELCGKWIQK